MSSKQQIRKSFQTIFFSVALLTLFSSMLLATFTPNSGSAPSNTTSYLDISNVIVVQPCGNVTISGAITNASNSTHYFNATVTAALNGTHNASIQTNNGSFQLNMTAPCSTQGYLGNFSLNNFTVADNSQDGHNKTFTFFVSNASNVSTSILNQKPPFTLSSNNTINVSYKNGSTALANNTPSIKVYDSSGHETSDIVPYNLTNKTDNSGNLQLNLSVGNDSSGTYTVVIDHGLAVFTFNVQAAYKLSFFPQTTSGETRGSFAPGTTINLVAKSRYANGTAYVMTGTDYITALVTLPNSSIVSMNLSAQNSTTSPGVNNKTFTSTTLPGAYTVRIAGFIQNNQIETFGQFDVRIGSAKLEAGTDFFKRGARENVILPGSSVRFDVLLYNNSDDSLIAGSANGGSNILNCSSIVLNRYTNLDTGANATWSGSLSTGTVNYAGSTTVCTLRVNTPATEGDYRINATLRDPTNSSLNIEAEGIVSVKTHGANFHICPAVSDFMPCGFAPFFEKNANATFEVVLQNYSSGLDLARSNIIGVTSIKLRRMSFSTGATGENTNWTANSSFFLVYPQTDGNAVRLVLDLPDTNATGPHEVEVTFNTSVGSIRAKEFFMVKGATVEAFGGPASSGGFNPQISCNGTFTFQLNAFDLKTHQSASGVKLQGVISATHVMSGTPLDASFLLNSTTNTTDSNGQATFNVTFNTSKSFKTGPYEMRLNITYKGSEDEAFSGFMCGSGGFDLFKPEGFGGGGDQGPGGAPGGGTVRFDGGITGNHEGFPPSAGPTATMNISYMNVGFGGQGSEFQGPGGQPGQPGGNFGSGFNGTLRITAMRFFNRGTGSERTIDANGTLRFNVSGGRVVVSISPGNFSQLSWPQGFMEFVVNLTNGSTPGLENGRSATGRLPGFESTPFRVFVDFNTLPGVITVGENVSVVYNVSSNVSTNGANFTMNLRSMTGQSNKPATLVSAVLLSDGWNQTSHEQGFPPGAEQWNVTFAVPNMPTGPVIIVATINNSLSVTNDFELFTKISAMDVQPMVVETMQMFAHCPSVLSNSNQNGTLQACNSIGGFNPQGGQGMPPLSNFAPGGNMTSRMNFTLFNTTYNVSTKSGNVCYKDGLNWTNLFNFDPMQNFGGATVLDNSTFVAVFDNVTPGVFDTLVFNNSQGNVTIMTMGNFTSAHRNFNRFNTSYNGLYVVNTQGCGMISIVNGSKTRTSTFNFVHLGRYPVSDVWYIPYRVVRGSAGFNGAIVDVLGFANMTLGFGGFENMLPSAQYRTTSSTSDANGFALVRANITATGEFMTFWKANATIAGAVTSVFAKLQRDEHSFGGGAGNQVQISAFNAYCGMFDTHGIQNATQNVTVNCTATYFNNTPLQGANFTLRARDFSTFPPSTTTLTVYNQTTGASIGGVAADASGQASIRFTMPSGWTQGRHYNIVGTAVAGSSSEEFHAGQIGFFGGFQGGFGGPHQFQGGGGP